MNFKKLLTTLAAIAAACAAFAAEPILLDTSRTGNQFYLTEYEKSEGRIAVVLRCLFSEAERNKTAALLNKQGVSAADANRLYCNDFKLRYSEDGSRYQRLYDTYLDAEGSKVFELSQNPDAWYDTPTTPELLPAKALLEASRLLGVRAALPQAAPETAPKGDFASAQSQSPQRVMSVAAMTAAFRADKQQFAADYENAIVQVRGVRGTVSRDYDMLSLLLLPSDGGQGILCLFSDDDAAAVSVLKSGSEVTVEGVYRKGKTPKAVFILDSCAILKTAKKRR